jgi:hypothetical protein
MATHKHADNKEWIGIDLDGCLAHYDVWVSEAFIGKPVAKMIARVKEFLAQGKNVKIFTARVSPEYIYPNDKNAKEHSDKQRQYIKEWLKENNLPELPITCIKDLHMVACYDDLVFNVKRNTGEVSGEVIQ